MLKRCVEICVFEIGVWDLVFFIQVCVAEEEQK